MAARFDGTSILTTIDATDDLVAVSLPIGSWAAELIEAVNVAVGASCCFCCAASAFKRCGV